MKKIKVGIVGFGNIGKEIKKQILSNKDFELVAIFARRKIKECVEFEKIEEYQGKIDLMFLCVGSQSDLEQVAERVLKNFNTIDCFDNHNKIKNYLINQQTIAAQNKKIAICSVGWDPGLFSLIRGLMDGLNLNCKTFWGKGLSQGHTQAIKNLPNVEDAIQFTIPNKNVVKQTRRGIDLTNFHAFHTRQCFVVCKKQFCKTIKQQILTMPDYFVGYKTKVKFVSLKKLNKIKSFAHKGEVVSVGDEIEFKLNLKSNPAFTAKIMIAYARALPNLQKLHKFGVFTILDIPIAYIIKKEKSQLI